MTEVQKKLVEKGTLLARISRGYKGPPISRLNGVPIEDLDALVAQSKLEWIEKMLVRLKEREQNEGLRQDVER